MSGPHVYIVTLAVPATEFRSVLEAIPGARFIRELPPRRVVVTLRAPGDRRRLARLPAVEAVVPDALEHPTRATS
jgi:hypothetical protein